MISRQTARLLGGPFLFLTFLCCACSTGEIDNFEGIRIESDLRVSYVGVRIVLVDGNQQPLIWGSSILSPEVGLSAIHPSEIITEAEIHSLQNGEKHKQVFSGQLYNLRWSRIIGTDTRILAGEIPHVMIDEDRERDTQRGILTVTVRTEKQGPFTDTLTRVRIYTRSLEVYGL